jgi:hypothetical protein
VLIATSTHVYAYDIKTPKEIGSGKIAALAEGEIYQVIAYKNGDLTLRTTDHCETLSTGIPFSLECLLICNESPLELLIGTGESHLYHFKNGKSERIESFDQMPERDRWHTPWGGPPDLRSLASTDEGYVYADIHVGSIMRSPDHGQSWEPVVPDLHEDVHQVATSQRSKKRVYANTAHGVYISDDHGQSWAHRSKGFPYKYGRAIAIHPSDPDCLLATVSKGPHGDAQGQLYRSDDAGRAWDLVKNGFPQSVSHNIDTFHLAFSKDGSGWVALEHDLYTSTDRGISWQIAYHAPEKIKMISCS